jgi:histone acetyltransferase (RNA polymerase elongator complex component)
MPLIIPVFISHQGCPHDCVFCNQERITGQKRTTIPPALVAETISTWLRRSEKKHKRVEVAFYGGSFTGLDQDYQEQLLLAVQPFIGRGQVDAIRLSTRPDYIDRNTIDFLQKYRVELVELGVQSLDDRVLAVSGRGHSAAQVRESVDLLAKAQMSFGVQLMVGLPEQTFFSVVQTTRKVGAMGPKLVRVYPVLVIKESRLAGLYEQGKYQTLSLAKAVSITAWMKKSFDELDIPVVRMGLQSGPDLERSVLAGPYHPAFGEMVLARIMLGKARKLLAATSPGDLVQLVISERDHSIFRGPGNCNMKRLQQLGLAERFTLHTDPSLQRMTLKLLAESNA